jgi:hypothetical protein
LLRCEEKPPQEKLFLWTWNSCSNDRELKKYCTDPIPEISTLFSNSAFPDDHGRRFPPLKQPPPRSLDYRPHSPFFSSKPNAANDKSNGNGEDIHHTTPPI